MMDVVCFNGCKLDKLELPKLKLILFNIDDLYIEDTILAQITEFIIPKVDINYQIFTKIDVIS